MEIRKTSISEIDTLMGLYSQARKFMAEHGNPNQWGDSYPDRKLIEQDVEEGCSYVCVEEGRIAATFFFKTGEDKTYREIYEGKWLNDRPYGVVHRITSDGTLRGAASFCLGWAFSQCGNLKIDTHEDNIVMQNMLKKNGFRQCGIIYIEDGSKRIAFQKEDE